MLELRAADRGVTYAKVMYWVREKDGGRSGAEFYSPLRATAQDLPLKTTSVWRAWPTWLVMEDALKKGENIGC